MPDLNFHIEGAQAIPFAVAPLLGFRIQVANAGSEFVHTVALRCQIQIEPARRRYSAASQAALGDLFGEPHRWGQTLRTMLWTHASAVVPAFSASTTFELQVPCTFDFNVAAVKYFRGVTDGEIPLNFQFSGTVFYEGDGGHMQVAPISWSKEATFRLPAKTWTEMMDLYYPNSAWLCLRRDVFEKLYQHKVRQAVPTWEEMLESLLEKTAEKVAQ